ncbi:MAG: 4-(cytidine 5'-diphospho)-2-C-methyl-D-erythritol kinase [Victivallaceae bacterium]|nr:4-(cytidine 5'-diphospho)-2-C-methyl-D-erythritol kinase [Victivallaceae bacterium]
MNLQNTPICDASVGAVTLHADAPSKVNLSLRVTGTRPDKYHLIDSVFLPLRFPADELEIRICAGAFSVGLVCPEHPELSGDGNLAARAARAYLMAGRMDCNAKILLHKHIPVAAGMGGGSADAGTVLRMLQSQFHAVSEAVLFEIAVALGADVPFFLNPKPARATGIGDKLEFFECHAKCQLVLIAPGFPVSAAWGYANLAAEPWHGDSGRLMQALCANDFPAICAEIGNDLEFALFRKYPILSIERRLLEEEGAAKVFITGSGPVLCGLYPDAGSAELAYRRLVARSTAELPAMTKVLLAQLK